MSATKRAPESRFWMLTYNNPVTNNPDGLFTGCHWCIDYAIWQMEMSESGTPHIQGYVILQRHRPVAWLHKHLIQPASWMIANGSAGKNIAYCSKADTRTDGPWEFGDKPTNLERGQGKRTDLEEVKVMLDANAPTKEIWDCHFGSSVRYHKSFSVYKAIMAKPRDFKSQVIVLVGSPGTGKSYWASTHTRNAYNVFDGKWFDGYDGQSDCIIDDFYGNIEFGKLLRMLDEYPTQVETKGGTINWAPRRIVITSNKHPSAWYNYCSIKGEEAALMRRITHLFVSDAPANELVFCGEWDEKLAVEDPYPADEEETQWPEVSPGHENLIHSPGPGDGYANIDWNAAVLDDAQLELDMTDVMNDYEEWSDAQHQADIASYNSPEELFPSMYDHPDWHISNDELDLDTTQDSDGESVAKKPKYSGAFFMNLSAEED